MILDVESKKNDLDNITDASKLKVISLLKLSDGIDNSLSTLNDLTTQASDLKNQDITSSELDVNLNKLKLDSLKALSFVVEDIQVEQSNNFEQLTQESDVESAINIVTENLNLSKKILENYSMINKQNQDLLTIKGEMLAFRIKYLGKDDYDKFTIIKKTVSSTSNLKNVVIIESIPKEIVNKASNLGFGIANQNIPVTLKEDPVLEWSVDDLSSTELYYQVNDLVDLSYIKNSRTVVLTKPDFKFSDRSSDQPDNQTSMTGLVPFDTSTISKLSFIQWLVIIGIGIVIFLGGYYVVLSNQEKNHKSSDNKNNIHKIITHARKNGSNRVKMPESKSINFCDSYNNKTSPVKNINMVSKSLTVPINPSVMLLGKIDNCNNIINNLDYEKARALFNECVSNAHLLSADSKPLAKEMLNHIYLKLYSYKTLHEARKHLYFRRHDDLKTSLFALDTAYSMINQRLSDVEDSKQSEELKFLIFLSESRNQIEKYRSNN